MYGGVLISPDFVARAILDGIRRSRYSIMPGLEMTAAARLRKRPGRSAVLGARTAGRPGAAQAQAINLRKTQSGEALMSNIVDRASQHPQGHVRVCPVPVQAVQERPLLGAALDRGTAGLFRHEKEPASGSTRGTSSSSPGAAGELVGTIGGVVNDSHNKVHEELAGGLGFLRVHRRPGRGRRAAPGGRGLVPPPGHEPDPRPAQLLA